MAKKNENIEQTVNTASQEKTSKNKTNLSKLSLRELIDYKDAVIFMIQITENKIKDYMGQARGTQRDMSNYQLYMSKYNMVVNEIDKRIKEDYE